MKCLFEVVTVGFEPAGHVLHDTTIFQDCAVITKFRYATIKNISG